MTANQLWMCNAEHQILANPNKAERQCKQMCDENGACNFVFTTRDLECRLFSSCTGMTATTEAGSIFKKLIGNQRFLDKNSLLRIFKLTNLDIRILYIFTSI